MSTRKVNYIFTALDTYSFDFSTKFSYFVVIQKHIIVDTRNLYYVFILSIPILDKFFKIF